MCEIISILYMCSGWCDIWVSRRVFFPQHSVFQCVFTYLLISGFIADVVRGPEITAKNGYSYGSNIKGKDRSLLEAQSRDFPTVTEKIRKETSLVCVPAKIRTHYLPGHTSEAVANGDKTTLYFCVTTPLTVNYQFPWPYGHYYTNFFYTCLL